jgi:DNA-binding CsgD family transcriptional regulator
MSIDSQVLFEGHQPTPRQLQVLELICQGYSSRQIADLLGVSVKTVTCHRMRLMERAGVHDSIRLFRWALRAGHVSLDDALAPTGPPPPGGKSETQRLVPLLPIALGNRPD